MKSVSSKRRYFCRVLGLTPTASRHEIRQAYRRLAKKWHPDRNPDHPYAERRFHEINQAYQALTDSGTEDADDSEAERGSAAAWHEARLRNRDPAKEHFFQRDGLDVVCDIPVTVPEAVLGFTLEMPTLRDKKLRLKVPPGVRDGTTFRIPGRGAVDADDRGDQLARIRIAHPDDPGPVPDRSLWEVDELGDRWPDEVRRVALAVGTSGEQWAPEASRGVIAEMSRLHRPAILANLHPDSGRLDQLFGAADRPGFREVSEGLADLQKVALRPEHGTFAYLPMGREDNLWTAARNRDERDLTQEMLHSRILHSVAEGIRQKGGILILYLPARSGQAAANSELVDGWIGLGAGSTELPSWAGMRSIAHIPRLSSGPRVNPRRRWAPVTLDEPANALAVRGNDAGGGSGSGSRSGRSASRTRQKRKERFGFLLRAVIVVAVITLSMIAGWLLAQASS